MKFQLTSVLSLLAITFHYTFPTVQGEVKLKPPSEIDLLRIHDCLEKQNVNMKAAKAYARGYIRNINRNEKCFASCILEASGVLVDGVAQRNVMERKLISSIPLDKITAQMTLCSDRKGEDKCETGYEILKCFTEEYGPITIKKENKENIDILIEENLNFINH